MEGVIEAVIEGVTVIGDDDVVAVIEGVVGGVDVVDGSTADTVADGFKVSDEISFCTGSGALISSALSDEHPAMVVTIKISTHSSKRGVL
ncbi:MAG: hypothetical protein LBV33_08345 [Lachnospiraceae bacterium]|jgi:hypothetical protein|nr:hypothetical protein [Lachnospiraceae bacterium]